MFKMQKENDNIIKEIVKGNGNQFTVKEILQAHITDGKDFEEFVRNKFETGTGKIAWNKSAIKWICTVGGTFGAGVSGILAWIVIQLFNMK